VAIALAPRVAQGDARLVGTVGKAGCARDGATVRMEARVVAELQGHVELAGEAWPLHGVFIRAPRIRELGPDVEVLGELDREPVLVRDGRFLLAAFHPELTNDPRVHELFLEMAEEAKRVRA